VNLEEHSALRDVWVAEYFRALDRLSGYYRTSRPGTAVGKAVHDEGVPVAAPLRLAVVDSKSDGIPSASIQLTGESVHRSVTDDRGVAFMDEIPLGSYQVLVMAAPNLMGTGVVVISHGLTEARIECNTIGARS
jgi:hypothetical protein